MGGMRNAYDILVTRPEGKRPLRRPTSRGDDNIRIDLSEAGREDVNWIRLAQDKNWGRALVNTIMNIRFHKRRGIS
jgi:hypothetical protein